MAVTWFNEYMEGKVGNIFETQFRYTVSKSGSEKVSEPQKIVIADPIAPIIDNLNITSKETRQKHVHNMLKNSGIVAASVVVLLTPLVAVAAKGKLPKSFQNFINKQINKTSGVINNLKQKPQMTKLEMSYLHLLQQGTSILGNVKGFLLNMSPFKDVLIEKTLRKMRLGKVCNGVTGFYKNMAIKMSNISYKKSSDSYAILKEAFMQANKGALSSKRVSEIVTINGVSKTVAEWSKLAQEKAKKIDKVYDTFRPNAVEGRQNWLSSKLDGFSDKIFDKTYGNLKSYLREPKKITNFVTEEMVAPIKQEFGVGINGSRKVITNTNSDVTREISGVISGMEAHLDMTNSSSVSLLKRVREIAKQYNINQSPVVKEDLVSQLDNLIKESSNILSTPDSERAVLDVKNIKNSLNGIREVITNNKKGELEEVLEIYKNILPESEYMVIKGAAKNSRNDLTDAVYTETEKFVDKMRDLNSGSAISDVGTGLLFPVATTAAGVAMADTKEEKRSVALNLGIPLLTGVGASMWATISMLAAAPSMVLGAGVTLATNVICSQVDKILKKNDAKILSQKNLELVSQDKTDKLLNK